MHFVQDTQLAGVKLSLREPLAREDCAIAQSFFVIKDGKKEDRYGKKSF